MVSDWKLHSCIVEGAIPYPWHERHFFPVGSLCYFLAVPHHSSFRFPLTALLSHFTVGISLYQQPSSAMRFLLYFGIKAVTRSLPPSLTWVPSLCLFDILSSCRLAPSPSYLPVILPLLMSSPASPFSQSLSSLCVLHCPSLSGVQWKTRALPRGRR